MSCCCRFLQLLLSLLRKDRGPGPVHRVAACRFCGRTEGPAQSTEYHARPLGPADDDDDDDDDDVDDDDP